MFHLRVEVIEHMADGTDKVIETATWTSSTGNSKQAELFIANSVEKLTGTRPAMVEITGANWRIDSPDCHYSWVATWEPYI